MVKLIGQRSSGQPLGVKRTRATAIRDEDAPRSAYGDALAEYARFRALGIEGLFSDHGDTAVAAWTS